jgi:polyhydroxyalkanoate synthesis regulator phasin
VDATTGGGNGHSSLQELLLAGIGWISLGSEAADELADQLSHRIGVDRDEVRAALRDTATSWKAEAGRIGARQDDLTERALRKLGLVRREEVDDLELRIAQLEHRLRLLEQQAPPAGA